MKTLTPAQRSELRARAHALLPVAVIGQKGLTPSVLEEIGRCLDAHELIKVRVLGEQRQIREAMLTEICEAAGAAAVQHIGKILVLFREKPAEAPPPSETKREARKIPRRTNISAAKPDAHVGARPRRRLATKHH
jgi:RNA-binding protein